MEKQYFLVEFQRCDGTECAQIARAETIIDVGAYYAEYFDVRISPMDECEADDAPHWGVAITEVPHREMTPEELLYYIPDCIHISRGNMKVGAIPNFSLTPGISCSREACETCHVSGCYAMKAYTQYPATRAAWDENTAAALYDPEKVEKQLSAYLSRKKPEFFRIHVGGDFITAEYARMWARVARRFPGTRFLAFTKQWDNIRGIDFPSNFALILSAWEGVTIPDDLRERFPVAHCIAKGADIPENSILCPGHCDTCGMCWSLRETGKDVAFYKH